jgi:hypothetical protein
VLPVIIFVAVAVPLLLIAFAAIVRRRTAGERPEATDPAATAAEQEEYEKEFADAEAYQEQWREEQHREHPDDKLY